MTRGRIIVAGSPHPRLSQLRELLEVAGHRVGEVANAVQTIQEVSAGLHDILIVDSGMEGMCEYDLCRAIRPRSDLGIILLVRDDDRQTRIDALEAGADDYLAAPFLPAELLARVRALLRRVALAGTRRHKLILSGRVVDLHTHEVSGPGCNIAHLTPKEFNVLQYLLAHANKPVSHRKLAGAVWRRHGNGDFEYLRVVIGQLRKKLELNPESPRHIITDRSLGYRLSIPPASDYVETELIPVPPSCLPPGAQNDIPAMVQ